MGRFGFKWSWNRYILMVLAIFFAFPIAHWIDTSLLHLASTTQQLADLGVGSGIVYWVYEKWGRKFKL